MRRLALLLCALALPAAAQPQGEALELVGHVGGRAALLQIYGTPQADGSERVTGEYLLLTTMQRRFLEGERSKQSGLFHGSSRG